MTRECPHCGAESLAVAVPIMYPTEDAKNICKRCLGQRKAGSDA